jgi:prepilin-type N-terminal cleavage/methylation domain-containing protein
MSNKKASGFSLVELVIVIVIIGVIAAIAIPRVTQASKGAGDAALKSNLSILRHAIELYASEHNGVYPGKLPPDGYSEADKAFEAQLTMFSNIRGEVSTFKDADHPLGPYLAKSIPTLVVGTNGTSRSVKVESGETPLTVDESGGYAWIYNCDTGEIIANSSELSESGKPYNEF